MKANPHTHNTNPNPAHPRSAHGLQQQPPPQRLQRARAAVHDASEHGGAEDGRGLLLVVVLGLVGGEGGEGEEEEGVDACLCMCMCVLGWR